MENFNKSIEILKAKRKSITMSDEAKKRIKLKLDEEYAKRYSEKKPKFNYSFPQKVAAIFICCFIISGCAFADDIGDFITKVFSNQNPHIDFAVENGYVQNIDMDYISSNGIDLKADYFYLDDYYMYIAFEIDADQEFTKVNLNEFEILDETNNIIYSNIEFYDDIFCASETKKINKKNGMLLLKLAKIQNEFLKYNKLKVNIQGVELEKDESYKEIYGNWNIEFLIDNSNKIESKNTKYYLESEKLVKKYDLELKNNILKVDLNFSGDYLENFSVTKNNVYLEDENKNIYRITNEIVCGKDKIRVLFPIKDADNINDLKLNIEYDNKNVLVFYLRKADS